jgi:hypothetical protein
MRQETQPQNPKGSPQTHQSRAQSHSQSRSFGEKKKQTFSQKKQQKKQT